MKSGIILLNLGGPSSTKEVRPFLYRLFSDPSILVGIPTPFRQLLAAFIALVKGGSSIKSYELIGGGSPQLKWTSAQASSLERHLLASAKGDDLFKVVVGMRTSRPNIGDALAELKTWGADKVILLPLFPQFSTTTTLSCFLEAERVLKKMNWKVPLEKVHSWPNHPAYIRLLRKTLEEALAQAVSQRRKPYVLVSAHSLPMKIIESGDYYADEVQKTVGALTVDLKVPWSLAFQSRNGPVPWLKPYTEDEIERLAAQGIEDIVVVPISFVSDHIETLYELDLLYADLAKSKGVKSFSRTRSFNDDPEFSHVLSEVLGSELSNRSFHA